MAVESEVLGWVRDACAEGDSWNAVRAALTERVTDESDIRLRPFVFAFAFHFNEGATENRQRAGHVYGPMIVAGDQQFPPALSEIEEVDVEAWREAFDALTVPPARARLGDLLWERRAQPRPDLAARGACDGFLELADDTRWHPIERSRCLSRALELVREVNDADRQQTVIVRMTKFVTDDLAAPGGGPGASLMVVRPLVALPASERPEELGSLLERIADQWGNDPYIIDAVAELRVPLLDAAAREQLARDQLLRWREEATKGDTLLRVMRLEHALELARANGLHDEAEELRRELGEISPEDLDLKTISADVEIPPDEVERFLGIFEKAGSWQEALSLLAAQEAPGGAPDQMAQQVEQAMADHPVQYLFSKAVIGPAHGSAIFRATDADSHRRLALAEERQRVARFWSPFCAEALGRIGARPDRPDREALTSFFTTDLIDAETAERLGRALDLYWDGLPDESAHVLAPRLERVIRELARQMGVPIVREPGRGQEVGGVEMLGALLRALKDGFADPGWHAYLTNLLADPLGLNLRNSIAHGLHGAVGRHDAALLLQAAIWLAMLRLQPRDDSPQLPKGAA